MNSRLEALQCMLAILSFYQLDAQLHCCFFSGSKLQFTFCVEKYTISRSSLGGRTLMTSWTSYLFVNIVFSYKYACKNHFIFSNKVDLSQATRVLISTRRVNWKSSKIVNQVSKISRNWKQKKGQNQKKKFYLLFLKKEFFIICVRRLLCLI